MTSVAQTPAQNPLVLGNTRFTFITPNLFRVEYALHGQFVDAKTMFAWDRSSLCGDVRIKELGNHHYEITTPALTLKYHNDGYPCSSFNLEVLFKKGDKECSTRTERGVNLGGPISTLDRVQGNVLTQEGLLSTAGYYVLADTGKDLVVDDKLVDRPAGHLQDLYYFVYGNDYKLALSSLAVISGPVPMTRKYMHGIWYCRYWNYTDKEFLQIIDQYDQHDFPIDNLVFDMGWHTQKEAEIGTGAAITRGWTGYTWNKEYISDPQSLIAEVHRRGLTVSLNDHPHDGIRPHEAVYPDFMAAIRNENPALISPDSVVIPDYGDAVYMKNFLKYAHGPSEQMGVDFWWLDWQQNYLYPNIFGKKTSTLAWLNKNYYEKSLGKGLRGASYSRWAGWGDHRYPIQFSGDAFSSWDVLIFEIKLTSISGNAGCYFWAHDIGGFYGNDDPELYARWTQFGALSASLKVHAMLDPKLDRRPWLWGAMAEQSARKAYHLRAMLFPYIYTSVWQTHKTMIPLTRPMYVEYPTEEEALKNMQEYLLGDLMLVAPITSPGKGDRKIASQKVWFPKGDVWYDWFSSEAQAGGRIAEICKDIDEFPLFVKGGWLLPMQPYTSRPAMARLNELVLRAYPGAEGVSNTYTLYEDDGISNEEAKGAFATTALTYRRNGSTVTVEISPVSGAYKGQPETRSYRLELAAVKSCGRVKADGKTVKPVRDEAIKGFVVELPARNIRKATTLTFERVE